MRVLQPLGGQRWGVPPTWWGGSCPPPHSSLWSAGTESFGLFSCMVNGEEREQTHRAVFR